MTKLPFPLLPEEGYQQEMEHLVLKLERFRQASGTSARLPERGIHWEYYAPDEGCEAVICISHGFTESVLKHSELIWYFLRAGFGVFICDHMGHGKSYRLLQETWLTHATSFADYIEHPAETATAYGRITEATLAVHRVMDQIKAKAGIVYPARKQ